MASKPQQSVYRTAKGAHLDMLKLINQNEMTIAVGNMNVNARGDKIGPGGKIIGREEIAGTGIPAQSGAKPVIAETPVETPVAKQSAKKDIKNMDPEGNE